MAIRADYNGHWIGPNGNYSNFVTYLEYIFMVIGAGSYIQYNTFLWVLE